MSVLNPPVAVQSRADTNADDFRGALATHLLGTSGLLPRGGIVPGWGAELAVTQRVTPGMGVLVGSGACVLASPTAGHGGWPVLNDASLDLTIAAAHATLPRTDLIIARVADPQYYAGGDGLAAIKVITGTAGAGAPVPSVPSAEGAYQVLAQVAVAAAATSITNGNITLNTSAARPYTVAAGGILPVANAAARTALFGYAGLHVYELDTGNAYVFTAAGTWRAVGPGPLGILGNAASGTPVTAISTTPVDLLTLAVTTLTGRRIRVRGRARTTFTATVPNTATVQLKEGATILDEWSVTHTATGHLYSAAPEAILLPTAGSHTYKLTMVTSGGTATADANANAPLQLYAEDIGV